MEQTETMETRLIRLLKQRWVTPLIALNAVQCMSLSQRCGSFARRGMTIAKRWVELPNGKRVRAYKIQA